MAKGKLIILDGPDGCGKTTQRIEVFRALTKKGIKAITTYEPGATSVGGELREILINKSAKMPVTSQTLLFFADRVSHLEEVILPALEKEYIVICDRYTPSTIVYQTMLKSFAETQFKIIHDALNILEADLTFIFKISKDEQSRRLKSKKLDRFEVDENFREQTIQAFLDLAKTKNYIIVDSSLPKQEITKKIVEDILFLLEN